jgi:hypothetical protein
MHVPPVQEAPHAPQFCESLVVLTHLPPQSTSGDAHTQLPLVHRLLAWQTWPQVPQLFGSAFV